MPSQGRREAWGYGGGIAPVVELIRVVAYMFLAVMCQNSNNQRDICCFVCKHPGMNKESFDFAMNFVLSEEGGTANHPRDPGGLTRFGISKRSYPDLDIANLTRDGAISIYARDYWKPICGDALPSGLALLVFDCAVNQGVGTAIRLLQESLYVPVDGVLGPVTLQAAQRSGPDLLREFCCRRAFRYEINRNEKTFGLGWFRRLFLAYTKALSRSLPP